MTKLCTKIVCSVRIKQSGKEVAYSNVHCMIERDEHASINLYIDTLADREYSKFRLTQNLRKTYVLQDRVKIITSMPNAEVTFENAMNTTLLVDFAKTLKSIEKQEVEVDSFELHKPKGISLCQDSMVITHKNMNVTAASKMKHDNSAKVHAMKRKASTISGHRPYDSLTPMLKSSRVTESEQKSALSDEEGDLELEAEDVKQAPSLRGDSKDVARLALLSAPIDFRTPRDPRPLMNSQLQVKSVYRPKTAREEFRNAFSSPYNKNYNDFETLPSSAHDGFENLGNTCYVNAVLQALINLPTFKESLIFNLPSVSDYQKSLHHLFSSVIRRKDTQKIVSPADLIDFIRKTSSQFETDTQQDADEFLRVILDKLQEEYGAADKENRDDNSSDSKQSCPITDTFEFEIERILTCTECENTVKNVSKYRDLSLFLQKDTLALSKTMDIKSLLSFFFKPTRVSYACEKCPSKSATVEQRILSLPRIMLMQLKRFDVDQRTMRSFKRSDEVMLNEFVALNTFLGDKTKAPKPVTKVIDLTDDGDETDEIEELAKAAQYRLQAVVSHIGHSPVAGHYICDAYDRESHEWKTYNDSQMTKCGSHRELQIRRRETGYLLFYQYQE